MTRKMGRYATSPELKRHLWAHPRATNASTDQEVALALIPVAAKYARRTARATGMDIEECESAALCGLAIAISRLDRAKCKSPASYCICWIRQQLQRMRLERLASKNRFHLCNRVNWPRRDDGAEPDRPVRDRGAEQVDARELLADLMGRAQLTSREQQAIRAKLSGLTLREMGAVLGMGRENARRLHQRAVAKLRLVAEKKGLHNVFDQGV